MTRNEASSSDDREALKQEIKQELRKEERHRRLVHSLGCSVIWLILLSIPFIFTASVIAKTGLMRVPLLSGWLYESPQPVRLVHPLAGTDADDLPQLIAAGTRFDPSSDRFVMTFKEEQLTTLVRAGAQSWYDQGALPFRLERPQVAIDDGQVEFFSGLQGKKTTTALRLRLDIGAERGRIAVTPLELVIGSQKVPQALTDLLFNRLAGPVTDGLQDGIDAIGALDRVEKGAGDLIFYLRRR